MKTSISGFAVFIQFIIIITFIFSGCEKNDNDSHGQLYPSGATLKTTVTGRITDTNGNILSGVTVKMGSITTVSDTRGYFLFVDAEVPKDRLVIVASKSGFFNCVSGKKTQNGDANYINLVMEELPVPVNIQSSTGGLVNIQGGATITFPASAFVDQNGNAYNGQVRVYSRHFSPGEANFEAMIPGGDLLAKNSLGNMQSLYSMGMIEAKLYDNTGMNEVKLAPGVTAELKFPIDPSQNANALSTIPMWHLDEETGIWQEEGQATKSGNTYIGNVSHFSTWNCDYPGERTDIQGLVVDCQNNPMANVVVTINGFQNVTTDNLGYFTTWVPAGYVIDCQVLLVNNPFIFGNSPVQSITTVAGQVNIIPTMVVPCATMISGILKTCGGLNSPGFVYATWNGGVRSQYTNTGEYKIYAPANTSVNIIAIADGFQGNATVLTSIQGTEIIAPNIELCSAGSYALNRFTLNVNSQQPITYLLDSIACNNNFIDDDGDGDFEIADIVMNAFTIPGNHNCQVHIHLNTQTQVGNYFILDPDITSYIHIYVDNVTYIYQSGFIFTSTSNKLVFTDYGVPGGVASCTFEYDWQTTLSGSGTVSGTITNGQFSFIRIN